MYCIHPELVGTTATDMGILYTECISSAYDLIQHTLLSIIARIYVKLVTLTRFILGN